jgi:two-component system, NarL family, invasion response regulator UvrY
VPVVEVLVVDDQATFRAVARIVVGLTPGLQVVGEAESGEQAVSLAASLRPGVVLMDINLPGISGIDVARQLVAANPVIVVILMSTYAPADLPADALQTGAFAYVRKEDLTSKALVDLLGI